MIAALAIGTLHNQALQSDQANLSCLLLAQAPRQRYLVPEQRL